MNWDWEKLKEKHGEKEPYKQLKKKREIPYWIVLTVYIMILLSFIILMWFPVRWIHYKLGYESKVKNQIIEMIKPEALKDEYRKKIF